MASKLKATVVSAEQAYAAGEATPHTSYRLRVRPSDGATEAWDIERRFSSFRELRQALPSSLPTSSLPSLDVHRLSDGLMPAVVHARAVRLQEFLDALLALGVPSVSERVARFLGAPAHVGSGGGGGGGGGGAAPAAARPQETPHLRQAVATPAPTAAAASGEAADADAAAPTIATPATGPLPSAAGEVQQLRAQLETTQAERAAALEQAEELRGHKRVLKKEVRLLRELAEGARVESDSLKQSLEDAARCSEVREAALVLREQEHERLMSQCLQLREMLRSADAEWQAAAEDAAPPGGRETRQGLLLRQVQQRGARLTEEGAQPRGIDGALCCQLGELLCEAASLRERLLVQQAATNAATSPRESSVMGYSGLGSRADSILSDEPEAGWGVPRRTEAKRSWQGMPNAVWSGPFGIDANGHAPGLRPRENTAMSANVSRGTSSSRGDPLPEEQRHTVM